MHVDFYSFMEWLLQFETYQVLVMTSQILLDLLSHGRLSLNKINLIIFDECHSAVSDYPMCQIMQRFESCPKEQQPRVLAVAACLLNSNVKLDKINSTIKARSKNSKLISIVSDVKEQLQQTGIYGCNKAVLLHLIQFEGLKKNSDDMEAVHVLEYLITEMIMLRKILVNEMKNVSEIEHVHSSKDLQQKLLYHVLKNLCEYNKEYNFLIPDFVVGFSNNPYKNAVEALCISKWNKEILLRFRNGLSNCEIAT
ncbi:hypothetical protein KM043_011367 [Ampulex compressa]|nr:hypothetical protein KM043_011367 [Ampulex compressa]